MAIGWDLAAVVGVVLVAAVLHPTNAGMLLFLTPLLHNNNSWHHRSVSSSTTTPVGSSSSGTGTAGRPEQDVLHGCGCDYQKSGVHQKTGVYRILKAIAIAIAIDVAVAVARRTTTDDTFRQLAGKNKPSWSKVSVDVDGEGRETINDMLLCLCGVLFVHLGIPSKLVLA